MMTLIAKYRRGSLRLSWVMAAISLFAPGISGASLHYAHTPVWFLIWFSIMAVLGGVMINPYLPLVLASVLMLITPALTVEREDGRAAATAKTAAACGLLIVWGVPIVCPYLTSGLGWHWGCDGLTWGCDGLTWGYYLFSIALTLAFVACVLPAALRTYPPVAHAGFPVVADEGARNFGSATEVANPEAASKG